MLIEYFIVLVVFYQIVLALRDFIVTGVLAYGQPADNRFLAYAVITTLEVTTLAALAGLTEPSFWTAVLKVWTIYLTWIGGILDWLYFIARKLVKGMDIPHLGFVWFWMPKIVPVLTKGKMSFEHPTTLGWVVWTFLMWIPNLLVWVWVLG